MAYAIGLDCGITSVGYAVLELDSNEEPCRIIRLGSRIFTAAENPKDGSSLAKPRREARSARRRLRRHRFRLELIKDLITQKGLLSREELDSLFEGRLTDIYQLRTEALDRALTNEELARVMIHLAQRRGFKSNRKADTADKEAGKLLAAVTENDNLMKEKGYRTVGEMYYKDPVYSEVKRNKGEKYLNTVSRAHVEAEARLIFEKQEQFGQAFATQENSEEYLGILLFQRSFDEGPGGNSPYGGAQIEKMIGKCTFFPDEKRAVKASYSFQLFSLLQAINHIRIVCNGETRVLTEDERKLIADLAIESPDINYLRIRKKLALPDEAMFTGVRYEKGKEEENEKKKKFNFLKPYHEVRKALATAGLDIKDYDKDRLNIIGYIFTVYKNEDKLRAALAENGFNEKEIEALLNLPSFTKTGHISVKACDLIIPHLQEGMTYDKACAEAGLDFRGAENPEKLKTLPARTEDMDDIKNPVVLRAISQTVKVINAIIREQDESPVFINIELAREMAKTLDERREAESSMKDNMAYNERIKEEIKNHFGTINPTGMDIVKLKLFKEQDGRCPYSLKSLDYERLFEVGYVDIDHIVPYSISFDDSYKNKVLVLSEENRQKGNRLPMEYLEGQRKEDFIVWVNGSVKNFRKRQFLLKAKVTDEDLENFKVRNLQDTQHLSSFLMNYIRKNLDFAPSVTGKKKRVTAVNGAVTSYMRKRWGIQKIREDGDLHHAVDAVVVGCVTDGIIRRVSEYSKRRESYAYTGENNEIAVDKRTGEVKARFPAPWPHFRQELDIRLSNNPARLLNEKMLPNYMDVEIENIKPCFVSRMPNRKVTGAAHKDTVRSPKALSEGMVISKKAISELKLDKDGEIEGYYNPSSDRLLYAAVKERVELLEALKKDGSKAGKERYKTALSEPLYKPKADGSPGPLVKKVKIVEKTSLMVEVNFGKGVAAHDTMVRVDIFFVEGEGYYFVPIYVADTVKDELPNRASVAYKPYDEWKLMDDKDFIFSLYPDDLIRVTAKKDYKMALVNKDSTLPKEKLCNGEMLYYRGAGISVASIQVVNHDNTYIINNMGIKTLVNIEKYQTDVLGNYHRVKNEKRQRFG
ncbi:MAG: type II CRISPR RNA-guided endonuclease Cas9 [Acutalibacteraceae bacterium]|jgi:CRISPR-associated endonuclease Csn1